MKTIPGFHPLGAKQGLATKIVPDNFVIRAIPGARPSGAVAVRRRPNLFPTNLSNPIPLARDRGSRPLTPDKIKDRQEGGLSILAGGEGLEPPLAESESAVLPLDDPPERIDVGRGS